MAASAPPARACPEGDGPLTAGYLVDVTHGGRIQQHWAEGAPERSAWAGSKVQGRSAYLTETWRCTACGALRSCATGRAP